MLIGEEGDDTLDGGDETDTAMFRMNRADYKIIKNDTGWLVSSTLEGNDKIQNIERLQFADTSLVLDSDAKSLAQILYPSYVDLLSKALQIGQKLKAGLLASIEALQSTSAGSVPTINNNGQLIKNFDPGSLSSWPGAIQIVSTGSSLSTSLTDQDYVITSVEARFYDVKENPEWDNPDFAVELGLGIEVKAGWVNKILLYGVNVNFGGVELKVKTDINLAQQNIKERIDGFSIDLNNAINEGWNALKTAYPLYPDFQSIDNVRTSVLTHDVGNGIVQFIFKGRNIDDNENTYTITDAAFLVSNALNVVEMEVDFGLQLNILNGIVQGDFSIANI